MIKTLKQPIGQLSRVLLASLLVLAIVVPIQGGTPHDAYGTVRDSEGLIPASADFSFIAYITTRPGDVLTEESTGCGYDQATGTWTVACGNFAADWTAGDILRVDFTDTGAGAGGDRTETGTVTCELTNAGSDNCGETSLPVELLFFRAIAGDQMVTLEWRTESEVNNQGFYIYRSLTDGSDYRRITTDMIEGAGNSPVAREYSYEDHGLENGTTYYYSLEAVDFGGRTEILETISATPVAPAIPTEYALSQNYPNPLNPETVIEYQLPKDSWVLLRVYTVTGQEVRTLKDDQQTAGYHLLTWDGADESGRRVASGIYVYKLQAGDFVDKKKMIVLR